MRRGLLGAGVMLAALTASLPAQAALTLCNRSSYILYAASAAIQSPRSETRGWTRLAPGECQMARKEPLTADTYLVHARSSLAHSGPARAWGGSYPMCVKDGNFTIKQSATQATCTAEGTFALPFAPLANAGKSVWTMNFDEQPVMSLTEAQLAGVKRLLKDNGYPIARIDGKPDKATGAALVDFRKRMRFSPTAGNAELFAVLEKEARGKIAPAGYTVCNDTHDALMVALGTLDHGKPVSRGWWTVAGGACARASTSALASDTVYLLAQRKSGGTLVGGPQRFCTTTVPFEIQGNSNCQARGLAESGFAPTATKGVSGYIARIGPAGIKR
jgi:uncharacterized membrane protein